MKLNVKSSRIFKSCVIIIFLTYLLIIIFSRFGFEAKKFKSFLVALVIILFFQYLIGDIISFLIYALWKVWRTPKQVEEDKLPESVVSDEKQKINRIDVLKIKIATLKAQLLGITVGKHRDEGLNFKYQEISNEISLYGIYFLLLTFLIISTHNNLVYYNTIALSAIFNEYRIGAFGLNGVVYIKDVYTFIEQILVQAFFNPKGLDGKNITEPGWIQFQMSKLLGVVRLRQLRYADEKIGLLEPNFDEKNYMPGWKLPYKRLHYTDSYWRIYQPWTHINDKSLESWFLPQTHYGDLLNYPESKGYIALLARNVQNSMKVHEFLKEQNWLDYKTAALFIDLTMYNVDSNIFGICTLMLERTPFGEMISHVRVHSTVLLYNLNQMSNSALFILLLYALSFIRFGKVLFCKGWHDRKFLTSLWNLMDFIIIILNILILIWLWLREIIVVDLLHRLEISNKLEFVDFRIAGFIDELVSLTAAILISLTTLRLWKVLQFNKVFYLFTETLFAAKKALASAILFIAIFVFGFGISSYMINGSNTQSFTKLVKSFVSSLCFSFGFSGEVSPEDLNYGGSYLGFVLYLLIMFSITILLINLFITIILEYFGAAKEAEEARPKFRLSYSNFLNVEFLKFLKFCKKLINKCCRRKRKEKIQNADGKIMVKIENLLDKKEALYAEEKESEDENEENFNQRLQRENEHLNRLRLIGEIINYQMDYLDRELAIMDIEYDSDDEKILMNPKNGKVQLDQIMVTIIVFWYWKKVRKKITFIFIL